MPNVVLEAMAAGLPVIATEVEGISELITDRETGLLISPQSSDALAEAITLLQSMPALRDTISHKAQSLVNQEFTWPEIVAAYAELYRRLLQK
jgi:glycosyltransferase involved in cell wall biosynthesis